MTKTKKAVLLVNLGTPDEPSRSAVYRYLKQFLLDPRVIDTGWLSRNLLVRGIIAPFRSGESAKLYQKLWTEAGSPLKVYGEQLTEGVAAQLGDDYVVSLGMRYQSPSIEQALESLLAASPSDLIVLPLFPQYASATTGSVHEEVMRLLSKRLTIPNIKLINSFPDYEPMIDVFVKNAKAMQPEQYDHILFSYHGLPERQLIKADNCNHCLQSPDCCQLIAPENQFCYSAQCHVTTTAIASKMELSKEDYSICFQSRLGRAEWIKPYTSDVVVERAKLGDRKLLVFCPAFVADCLETRIEIEEEYREEFLELGGEQLDLVSSLNADPDWITAVRNLVIEHS